MSALKIKLKFIFYFFMHMYNFFTESPVLNKTLMLVKAHTYFCLSECNSTFSFRTFGKQVKNYLHKTHCGHGSGASKTPFWHFKVILTALGSSPKILIPAGHLYSISVPSAMGVGLADESHCLISLDLSKGSTSGGAEQSFWQWVKGIKYKSK